MYYVYLKCFSSSLDQVLFPNIYFIEYLSTSAPSYCFLDVMIWSSRIAYCIMWGHKSFFLCESLVCPIRPFQAEVILHLSVCLQSCLMFLMEDGDCYHVCANCRSCASLVTSFCVSYADIFKYTLFKAWVWFLSSALI